MLEHTIIQYFLSSFLWTFYKPLLFTVTVNFLQTQDFKKEQKQKNSFAFHSQVWATRSHSWKKSWGSRCLKKTEEIQPWHDSEKNFSPVRNTRCLLWMKESQHSTEMHGAKVWSASGCSGLLESNTFPVWLPVSWKRTRDRTGASPKIAYETEEDQVIAGLVAQGFGIAVVPYMDILQKLNVNILQIRSPNYERAFFMVHNDCVFIPPVVQKFRQFVLDDGMMLTEEPAWLYKNMICSQTILYLKTDHVYVLL